LYDYKKDPLDLYPSTQDVRKAGFAPMDQQAAITLYERNIKNAGYKGYISSDYSAGVLFYPTKLTKVADSDRSLPVEVEQGKQFMPEGEAPMEVSSLPGGVIVPSDLDLGKSIAEGRVSKLRDGDIIAGFRYLPENFDEKYELTESQWKRLQGKSGFAFVSDWADSERKYITKNGREIDVMFGGIGYPFIPEMQDKAAWASTGGGTIISRVLNLIAATDGIGLVVLGAPESSASSRAFSMAFMEELNDALSNKTITRKQLDKIVVDASKAHNKKSKKKINLTGYDDWVSKFGELSFESRALLVKSIGSHVNKKEFGIMSWNDVLKKYNIQKGRKGKYSPGQIVAVVEFSKVDQGERIGKGTRMTASQAGVPEHPSYEVVLKGKGLGTVRGLTISQFFRDFFNQEGTKPALYTRKVQTKMPKFTIGVGSAQLPRPTNRMNVSNETMNAITSTQ